MHARIYVLTYRNLLPSPLLYYVSRIYILGLASLAPPRDSDWSHCLCVHPPSTSMRNKGQVACSLAHLTTAHLQRICKRKFNLIQRELHSVQRELKKSGVTANEVSIVH